MADESYTPKVYTEQDGDRQVVASGGSLDVESGGEIDIEAGGAFKFSGANGSKVAKVALAAADAAAGVFAWQNPESSRILVDRVILDVTTKSTGACTLDVGIDGDGTGSADTAIDGVDVGTAAGVFDNIKNKGTNGQEVFALDENGGTNDYLTASKATGAAAGLAGNAYILYTPV